MDAGDRWMINDAAGKPMFAWDSRDNVFMSSYDALHRPTKLELKNLDHPAWIVVGLTQYGEGTTGDQANNRRGKPYRSFDQSGVVTNQEFDFKGNALGVSRRLANDYNVDTDWKAVLQLPLNQEPGSLLMAETFTQITEYDAVSRMTRQYNWHRAGKPVAVYKPGYNERGLLVSEDLTVGASKTATATGHSGGKKTSAIQDIRYDAKGQRLSIKYGNNVTTKYTYDPNTFRLLTLVSTRLPKPGLQDLSYTYDPSGNITEIFDVAVPTEYFDNAVIEPRKRYVYDALYRLIEATGREHVGQLNHDARDNWNDCPYRVDYGANNSKAWRNYTQRYTYDSVGNILVMQHIAFGSSADSWTRQYQYATDSNRLLSTGTGAAPANRYATSPTLAYRYSYDVHGSMTSLPHLPTMDWDYTDHLRHISRAPASQGTDPDGCPNSSLEAWYRYDEAKQRTRKRVKKQGGLVEERFYLGGLEWYSRTLNGALVEEIETLHLFDGEQRLLMVDQVFKTDRAELGTRILYRYTLSNHLGSSTVEVDENASVISYEEYHPYGTTAYQSGALTGGKSAKSTLIPLLALAGVTIAGSAKADGSAGGAEENLHYELEATAKLKASAVTERDKTFANMIGDYSSLLITWTLRDEADAHAKSSADYKTRNEFSLNPFYLLDTSSSYAGFQSSYTYVLKRAETALTKLENDLAKNDILLTGDERHAIRAAIGSAWGITVER